MLKGISLKTTRKIKTRQWLLKAHYWDEQTWSKQSSILLNSMLTIVKESQNRCSKWNLSSTNFEHLNIWSTSHRPAAHWQLFDNLFWHFYCQNLSFTTSGWSRWHSIRVWNWILKNYPQILRFNKFLYASIFLEIKLILQL